MIKIFKNHNNRLKKTKPIGFFIWQKQGYIFVDSHFKGIYGHNPI